jgi:uncharacterized protein
MPDLRARVAVRVRKLLEKDGTGHDWWHIHRVCRLADRIARTVRGVDRLVVSLGALLHDVGDWKFHGGDLEAAPREAARILSAARAPLKIIPQVESVCREVSFKGAGVADRPTSMECRIVQDADRLDAIGAIGVARAFAYGGAKGRALYDPGVPPVLHASFAAYRRNRGHTINHFHEKLLLLKERLHTPEARRLAVRRHAFLERFLSEFLREWAGR